MPGGESLPFPPLDARVHVPAHVLMRQVGDELVMLSLEKESYYGLNAVGARLMELAETGATLEDILERLLAEFEVGRDQLEADIRRVAGELMAARLLEQQTSS